MQVNKQAIKDDIVFHDLSNANFDDGPEDIQSDDMLIDESSIYGMRRWRCVCGTFWGKQFEGNVCPFCKKPIEDRGKWF